MVIKIASNQQVVWRSPQSLQVGAGQKRVILEDLSPGEEKLVAALYQGIADNQLAAIASQAKLALDDATNLVSRLQPLLQQVEPAIEKPKTMGRPRLSSKIAELDAAGVASAFAEIIRASLVNGCEGEQVLLERARRVVHIDSLDRTGLTLTLALAAAGLGAVISHDQNKVLPQDTGATGFQLTRWAQQDLLRPNGC